VIPEAKSLTAAIPELKNIFEYHLPATARI